MRRGRLGFGLFLSATAGVILGNGWTAADTTWWWIGALTMLAAALLVLSSFYARGRTLGPPPRQQRPVETETGVVARWPVPTLGELLVEKYRLITVAQLRQALERQRKAGGRLGDILVEVGLVSKSHLDAVLEDQRPRGDPSRSRSWAHSPMRRMAALLAGTAIVALFLCGCAEKQQGVFAPAEKAPSSPAVERMRAGATRANLLVVLMDAARPDHFGAYGYHRHTTPNVDQLCAHSIVFDQAYCQAPNTKASVASLLTSQFPDTHGVVGMFRALPEQVPTLAEILQAEGFRTVCLSANPFLSSEFGFERGFDDFLEVFREADLGANELGPVPADLLGRAAISWLQEHQEERFFAYLHFLEPHDPYHPPEPFRMQFAAAPGTVSEIALYDANLAYGDSVVGQVLAQVGRLGLMEQTVVVFLADHGEALGEHGRFGHQETVYEETIRIPLAIRLPPACGGEPRRCAEIVSITDLMPTLLDLLGAEFPPTMQGKSRLALLAGEEDPEPRYAVSRSRGRDQTGGAERPEEVIYALTGPQHTLLWGDRGRRVELYDRALDPAQERNIASEQREVTAELRRRFEEWAATQQTRPVVLRGGKAPVPQQRTEGLSDRTRDHLKALGYLK